MLNKVVDALTTFAKDSTQNSACIILTGEIKIPKSLK